MFLLLYIRFTGRDGGAAIGRDGRAELAGALLYKRETELTYLLSSRRNDIALAYLHVNCRSIAAAAASRNEKSIFIP